MDGHPNMNTHNLNSDNLLTRTKWTKETAPTPQPVLTPYQVNELVLEERKIEMVRTANERKVKHFISDKPTAINRRNALKRIRDHIPVIKESLIKIADITTCPALSLNIKQNPDKAHYPMYLIQSRTPVLEFAERLTMFNKKHKCVHGKKCNKLIREKDFYIPICDHQYERFADDNIDYYGNPAKCQACGCSARVIVRYCDCTNIIYCERCHNTFYDDRVYHHCTQKESFATHDNITKSGVSYAAAASKEKTEGHINQWLSSNVKTINTDRTAFLEELAEEAIPHGLEDDEYQRVEFEKISYLRRQVKARKWRKIRGQAAEPKGLFDLFASMKDAIVGKMATTIRKVVDGVSNTLMKHIGYSAALRYVGKSTVWAFLCKLWSDFKKLSMVLLSSIRHNLMDHLNLAIHVSTLFTGSSPILSMIGIMSNILHMIGTDKLKLYFNKAQHRMLIMKARNEFLDTTASTDIEIPELAIKTVPFVCFNKEQKKHNLSKNELCREVLYDYQAVITMAWKACPKMLHEEGFDFNQFEHGMTIDTYAKAIKELRRILQRLPKVERAMDMAEHVEFRNVVSYRKVVVTHDLDTNFTPFFMQDAQPHALDKTVEASAVAVQHLAVTADALSDHDLSDRISQIESDLRKVMSSKNEMERIISLERRVHDSEILINSVGSRLEDATSTKKHNDMLKELQDERIKTMTVINGLNTNTLAAFARAESLISRIDHSKDALIGNLSSRLDILEKGYEEEEYEEADPHGKVDSLTEYMESFKLFQDPGKLVKQLVECAKGGNALCSFKKHAVESADQITKMFKRLFYTIIGYIDGDHYIQVQLKYKTPYTRYWTAKAESTVARLSGDAVALHRFQQDEYQAYKEITQDMKEKPWAALAVRKWKTDVDKLADVNFVPGVTPLTEPLWVHIYGKAGTSKSTMVYAMMSAIYPGESLDQIRDKVFNRFGTNDYWDGFKPHHKILFYDDLGSDRTDSTDWKELINVVSVAPFVPQFASLDNAEIGVKGTVVKPEVVFSCSNLKDADGVNALTSPAPIRRRMHLVLEAISDATLSNNAYKDDGSHVSYRVVSVYDKEFGDTTVIGLPAVQELISRMYKRNTDRVNKLKKTWENTMVHNETQLSAVKLSDVFDIAGLQEYATAQPKGIQEDYNDAAKEILTIGAVSSGALFVTSAASWLLAEFCARTLAGNNTWKEVAWGVLRAGCIAGFVAVVVMAVFAVQAYIVSKMGEDAESHSGEQVKVVKPPTHYGTPKGGENSLHELIVRNMGDFRYGSAKQKCFFINQTHVITTKHALMNRFGKITEGENFHITFRRGGQMTELPVEYKESNIVIMGSEAVMLEIPPTFDNTKDMVRHFFDGGYNMQGRMFEIDQNGRKVLARCTRENVTTFYPTPDTAHSINKDYIRNVASFELDFDSLFGSCSVPAQCVDMSPGQTGTICGILHAGIQKRSVFHVITRQMIVDALSQFKRATPRGASVECLPDVEVTKLHLHQPSKTSFIRSDIHDLVFEHTTEPAILSVWDPRNSQRIDPLFKAQSGYIKDFVNPRTSEKADEVPYVQEIVDSMVDEITDLKSTIPRRILSFSEALNGVPFLEYVDRITMNTSPGGYEAIKKMTREQLLPMEDGQLVMGHTIQTRINEFLFNYNQGKGTDHFFTDVLKDERRKLKKIRAVDTRLVSCCELSRVIIGRKYFLPIIAHLMQNCTKWEFAPGVDRTGTTWHEWVARLLEVSDTGSDGDYAAWDKSIQPGLYDVCVAFLDRLCEAFYGPGTVSHDFIKGFVSDVKRSKHITNQHGVTVFYYWDGNMPSGDFFTTFFNCFLNSYMLRLAYLELVPKQYASMDMYKHNVRTSVYGDDNVLSIVKQLLRFYNQETIGNVLARYGFDYTPADKENPVPYKKVMDLSFLKNVSIKHNGWYTPKMELGAAVDQINWVRHNNEVTDSQQMLINIANVMRTMFAHGKPVYDDMRKKIRNVCEVDIPRYETLDRFHAVTGTLPGGGETVHADSFFIPFIEAQAKPKGAELATSLVKRFGICLSKKQLQALVHTVNCQLKAVHESSIGCKSSQMRTVSYVGRKIYMDGQYSGLVPLTQEDLYANIYNYLEHASKKELQSISFEINCVLCDHKRKHVQLECSIKDVIEEDNNDSDDDIYNMEYAKPKGTEQPIWRQKFKGKIEEYNIVELYQLFLKQNPWACFGCGERALESMCAVFPSCLGMLEYDQWIAATRDMSWLPPTEAEIQEEWLNKMQYDEWLFGPDENCGEPAVVKGKDTEVKDEGMKAGTTTETHSTADETKKGKADHKSITKVKPHNKTEKSKEGTLSSLESTSKKVQKREGVVLTEHNEPAKIVKPRVAYEKDRAERHMNDKDWDLNSMLQRFTLFDTLVWEISDADGVTIREYNIMADMLRMNISTLPFTQFSSFRCESITIRIQVVASRYHQGRLVSYFIPHMTDKAKYRKLVNTTDATLFQHCFLDPAAGTTVDMVIPFTHYKGWINYLLGDSLGSLRLTVFNALKAANTAPTTVQIKCFFAVNKPQFRIPRAGEDNSQRLLAMFSSNLYAVPKGIEDEVAQEDTKESELPSHATEALIEGTLDKPSVLELPSDVTMKIGTPMCYASGNDGVSKLVLYPRQEQYTDKEHFGVDDTNMTISHFAKTGTLLNKVKWEDTMKAGTVLVGGKVGPLDVVFTSDNEVITSLDWISRMFAYWRGSLRFTIVVVTSAFHEGKLEFTYHPDLLEPPKDIYAGMSQYAHVMSVRNTKNIFVIDVPYLAETPWKRVSYGNAEEFYPECFAGSWALRVSAPLRVPTSVVNEVDINIFVSGGPDFELYLPAMKNTSLTNQLYETWFYRTDKRNRGGVKALPKGQEDLEGADENYPPETVLLARGEGYTSDPTIKHFGEDYDDLLDLCKRYYECPVAAEASADGKLIAFEIDMSDFAFGWFQNIISLYGLFRGSLRFKYFSHGGPAPGMREDAQTPQYITYVNDPLPRNTDGSILWGEIEPLVGVGEEIPVIRPSLPMIALNEGGIAEFEVPMNTRYATTPILPYNSEYEETFPRDGNQMTIICSNVTGQVKPGTLFWALGDAARFGVFQGLPTISPKYTWPDYWVKPGGMLKNGAWPSRRHTFRPYAK